MRKKKYLFELHTVSIIHYSEVLLVIIELVQRERSVLDKIKASTLNISGCWVVLLLCTEKVTSDFLDNFGSDFYLVHIVLIDNISAKLPK